MEYNDGHNWNTIRTPRTDIRNTILEYNTKIDTNNMEKMDESDGRPMPSNYGNYVYNTV
jgi:hypothetical protein